MTTQRHEIEAWLGDDHGLTEDQIEGLVRYADRIGERYPDPDDAADREAALTATYRIMIGDTEVIDEAAGKLLRARVAEAEALATLRQAALLVVAEPIEHGTAVSMTEAGFARRAGVDRMAVRGWLGKRASREPLPLSRRPSRAMTTSEWAAMAALTVQDVVDMFDHGRREPERWAEHPELWAHQAELVVDLLEKAVAHLEDPDDLGVQAGGALRHHARAVKHSAWQGRRHLTDGHPPEFARMDPAETSWTPWQVHLIALTRDLHRAAELLGGRPPPLPAPFAGDPDA